MQIHLVGEIKTQLDPTEIVTEQLPIGRI